MKKKIEVTAKKVQDAIAEGLKILQLTIDDVDVKILSSGGLFRKSVVELYYGEDIIESPVKEVIAQKNPEPQKDIKDKKAEKPVEPKKEFKAEKPVEPKKEVRAEKPAEPKKEVKVEKPVELKNFAKPEKLAEQKKDAKPENSQDVKPENKSARPFEKSVNKTAVVDRVEKNGKHFKTHDSVAPSAEQVTLGKNYLATILKFMDVDCSIESVVCDGVEFNIITENSKIIGYRGEVLDALQYLTSLKVNESSDKYVRVKLDGLDYRAKRKGILENLAVKLAEKCVRTGKRVTVEPMDSMDRRIIHARLADRDDVITKSEGKEPSRRVVIYLRNNKQETK